MAAWQAIDSEGENGVRRQRARQRNHREKSIEMAA